LSVPIDHNLQERPSEPALLHVGVEHLCLAGESLLFDLFFRGFILRFTLNREIEVRGVRGGDLANFLGIKYLFDRPLWTNPCLARTR